MRSTLVLTCFLLAGCAWAQETPSYRLNFAFREMEGGKSISTRNYTLLASPQTQAKFNIGTKVPVVNTVNTSQYSYVDVGVNVRARIQERGAQLMLNAEVEVSNLGADRENTGRPAPRIQQLRSEVDTVIPLGQATPLVALDDPASPRHYEIEVTATKVK
jgi:uncharacterized protein YcfL